MGELSLGLRRKKKNKKKQTKLKVNVSILENNPGNISDIPDWWWKWWWWCQRWQKKWPEAKFGGNDRGFHLEANMSGLQAAAAAHWEAAEKALGFWSWRSVKKSSNGDLSECWWESCLAAMMMIVLVAMVAMLVLVRFTWIICDDFNESDDDCDCSVIGDCAGSTWCSILSMSIGGCATPSKGIGDSLRKPSSQLLKDQPRHQTTALLTIKLLHLPLVHLLHQVIFFLAIKRKRRYVVMMWMPHFTWWNSTLEKNTTWLLHCWRNTPPACNNTLVFNLAIHIRSSPLLSSNLMKLDLCKK